MTGGVLSGMFGGLLGNVVYPTQTNYSNLFTTATTSALVISGVTNDGNRQAPRSIGPESALSWLDRRINEMRVKL